MKPYPRMLNGARVTVMGLGQFGGGLGVTRWLVNQGAKVLLTDRESAEKLRKPLAELEPLIAQGSVQLRLGAHHEDDFRSAELVIANPAVPLPWQNAYLCAAREAGTPVTTEIRLTVDGLDRLRTIGVTGSAGKSSTASMLELLLNLSPHRARLGGNIGGSLLGAPHVEGAWNILELSSAMLWWLTEGAAWAELKPWSPRVAVFTNLAVNHVDWHGSFAHYAACKSLIRAGQREGDAFLSLFAVEQPAAAAEVARLMAAPQEVGPSVLGLDGRASHTPWWECDAMQDAHGLDELLQAVEIPMVPGEHQRRNGRLAIMAAEAAIATTGATPNRSALLERLKQFRSLPHRLEFVGEFGGMRCFNDSKSTTPEATMLAIASFPEPKKIHLIAGGYDKGADLSAIRQLAPNLAGLYAIGATAPKIAAEPPAVHCDTLERAVLEAAGRAKPGDVLLLSPACASWGQFTNYEERGETFSVLVKNL